MKTVTPSGKVFYTDRELTSTPAGKTQPLTGGQVLSEVPAAKPASSAASAPADAPNAPPGTPAGTSSDTAVSSDEALKAQEKSMKDAQMAAEKMNCENARKRLASMQGRVTKVNAKGEKEMLNDAQMGQEKQRAQQLIGQYCK